MRRKTPAQVATLMDLSDKLAQLNVARYAAWEPWPRRATASPPCWPSMAMCTTACRPRTLKTADLSWAQQHLVILSGLYGVLRPLDRLQPYRLEMGTRWPIRMARTLYAFWGDTLAEHLNARQADDARAGARQPGFGGIRQGRAAPGLARPRGGLRL
jgi:cytoplasmic iron level regulating protein YaaA (DUF328/UPF0246 family)